MLSESPSWGATYEIPTSAGPPARQLCCVGFLQKKIHNGTSNCSDCSNWLRSNAIMKGPGITRTLYNRRCVTIIGSVLLQIHVFKHFTQNTLVDLAPLGTIPSTMSSKNAEKKVSITSSCSHHLQSWENRGVGKKFCMEGLKLRFTLVLKIWGA